MKSVLIIVLLACTGTAVSQTKLIFHKSHSGSRASFVKTINGNYSNFGAYPIRQIKNSMLDSVIYLTDTSAIMVTSEYCGYYDLHHPEFEGATTTRDPGNLWRAGRDTVYNHPLFTRKHSLDSIRMVVATEYFFNNNVDSTQFVGYDNAVVGQEQKVVKSPSKRNGNEMYLILVFVIAVLLFSMVPAARSSQPVR